jgi:hypothetical protein
MDQSNDRDPDDRIGDNKTVPQSAAGRIMLFQHRAVHMFCDHRRLPGKKFPQTNDSSAAVVSIFWSFAIIGEFVTHDAITFVAGLRDST